jgi:hypothetical protein
MLLIEYIEVMDMPRVIIVEPDITPEENERNWKRVEDIINQIVDDLRMKDEKELDLG